MSFLVELFGHRIPAPILFAPIGINKLYSPLGELIPAKIAGELGLPVCFLSLALPFLHLNNEVTSVLPVHRILKLNRRCCGLK